MLDFLERLLPFVSAFSGVTIGLWTIFATRKQKHPVQEPPVHTRGRTIATIIQSDGSEIKTSVYTEQDGAVYLKESTRPISTGIELTEHAFVELTEAAEDAVRRPADWDAGLPPDGIGHLSPDDEQLVAKQTADDINLTLARLFLRLGPPPLGTDGDLAPVSSGDGGSAQ